jgi:polyvinyl alcohol dehydrogenase (cytochrome)
MMRRRIAVSVAAIAALSAHGAYAGQGSEWNTSGGDRQNTRSQPSEHTLSVANVNQLEVKWAATTDGDVSATPAVDSDTVYFPDWGGYVSAVNKATGALKWKVKLSNVTGIPNDKSRSTPAVTDDKIIFGTQGAILAGGGPGGKIVALKKATGAVAWVTQAESHFAAIITQAANVFDGRV